MRSFFLLASLVLLLSASLYGWKREYFSGYYGLSARLGPSKDASVGFIVREKTSAVLHKAKLTCSKEKSERRCLLNGECEWINQEKGKNSGKGTCRIRSATQNVAVKESESVVDSQHSFSPVAAILKRLSLSTIGLGDQAKKTETKKPGGHFLHDWNMSCSNTIIERLVDDPCYDYASGSQKLISQCGCGRKSRKHYNEVSYIIPPIDDGAKPLSSSQLSNETIFAFIHVNKAAGTTVKHALFETIARNKWDGAPYGTFRAWKLLGPTYPKLNSSNESMFEELSYRSTRFLKEYRKHQDSIMTYQRIKSISHSSSLKVRNAHEIPHEPLYITCGDWVLRNDNQHLLRDFHGGKNCPLRTVWGGLSMGLCDHFPGRPCVYFIILRDPIKRAISDFNYFCTEGAENRKKWTALWHHQGECTANIIEYYQQRITSPQFLVERLTRGCDKNCGTQAAIQNLQHPCLRYLILEDLEYGLKNLATLYGSPMGDTFLNMIALKDHRNKKSLTKRTMNQISNPQIYTKLSLLLKQDIEIYEWAKRNYKKQWDQPLHSCNSLG